MHLFFFYLKNQDFSLDDYNKKIVNIITNYNASIQFVQNAKFININDIKNLCKKYPNIEKIHRDYTEYEDIFLLFIKILSFINILNEDIQEIACKLLTSVENLGASFIFLIQLYKYYITENARDNSPDLKCKLKFFLNNVQEIKQVILKNLMFLHDIEDLESFFKIKTDQNIKKLIILLQNIIKNINNNNSEHYEIKNNELCFLNNKSNNSEHYEIENNELCSLNNESNNSEHYEIENNELCSLNDESNNSEHYEIKNNELCSLNDESNNSKMLNKNNDKKNKGFKRDKNNNINNKILILKITSILIILSILLIFISKKLTKNKNITSKHKKNLKTKRKYKRIL